MMHTKLHPRKMPLRSTIMMITIIWSKQQVRELKQIPTRSWIPWKTVWQLMILIISLLLIRMARTCPMTLISRLKVRLLPLLQKLTIWSPVISRKLIRSLWFALPYTESRQKMFIPLWHHGSQMIRRTQDIPSMFRMRLLYGIVSKMLRKQHSWILSHAG